MTSQLLKARISDTADICERTSKAKFLGFLSLEQAALAKNILSHRNIRFDFFGGYEDAKRVILGCFPEWDNKYEYPVTAITALYRKTDSLSHRDFLGSLISLGLKRESIGDILIEDGRAVFFVSEEISGFILQQLKKVGGCGVTLKNDIDYPLPKSDKLCELTVTAASERLDCVVSAIIPLSRSDSAQRISQATVSVNSVIAEKATRRIACGDVISVRGFGKYIIDSVEDRTRKNRIIIKYRKYV